LFLILEVPCNAKLVEKSFETGKRGVYPSIAQCWEGNEFTITLMEKGGRVGDLRMELRGMKTAVQDLL
jgi:hypothetical protein